MLPAVIVLFIESSQYSICSVGDNRIWSRELFFVGSKGSNPRKATYESITITR